MFVSCTAQTGCFPMWRNRLDKWPYSNQSRRRQILTEASEAPLAKGERGCHNEASSPPGEPHQVAAGGFYLIRTSPEFSGDILSYSPDEARLLEPGLSPVTPRSSPAKARPWPPRKSGRLSCFPALVGCGKGPRDRARGDRAAGGDCRKVCGVTNCSLPLHPHRSFRGQVTPGWKFDSIQSGPKMQSRFVPMFYRRGSGME
jgi:hypothetical protein